MALQDRLFKGYSMSIYNQSLYVTLMSAAYSVFGLLTSRQLGPGIAFLTRHPEALWQIASLSAAATAGVYVVVKAEQDPQCMMPTTAVPLHTNECCR